ncbi:MAG TPA: hypothetical protein VFU30_03880 [Gaiellaceae bacterium]|nr:hypothetical protein [Gaiellaceae bacterium]
MTHKRFAPFALAAATLAIATPALAGNAGEKALRVEQLGPKHLLGEGSAQTDPTTSTTKVIPITFRTLVVEELGPKYLLR